MLGGLCFSDGIALLLGLEYVGWSLFSHTQVLGVELCRLTNKDHPAYSSPRSKIIPSDQKKNPTYYSPIRKLYGLNVGWSLFVRQYNFTPKMLASWVVFVGQTL
jgi:hypothetical protein